MTETYESSSEDDNIDIFDIKNNIIDKKDDSTFLIKMSFNEVIVYTTSWCYNRRVNEEKVEELYKSLQEGNNIIPFILHAVYDVKHEDSRKIRILDGQHRVKAIEKFIANDIHGDSNHYVWICLYKIDHTETNNTKQVLDLFKKINNNRVFTDEELPDTFIIDFVNAICDIPLFKKNDVIGIKTQQNHCHQPRIHKKELNAFLNYHKEFIQNSQKNIQELIENLQIINNKLSMKTYEELFTPRMRSKKNEGRWKKAVTLRFFLNLQESKYAPKEWIKYIVYPNAFP
jgi:hypothetical protein